MFSADISAKMSWSRTLWRGEDVGREVSPFVSHFDDFDTALRTKYPPINAAAIRATTSMIPAMRTLLHRFEGLLFFKMMVGWAKLSSSGCSSILVSNKCDVSGLSIGIKLKLQFQRNLNKSWEFAARALAACLQNDKCVKKWVTTPSKQMSQFSRCERYVIPLFLKTI